jgi:hypothetical protein
MGGDRRIDPEQVGACDLRSIVMISGATFQSCAGGRIVVGGIPELRARTSVLGQKRTLIMSIVPSQTIKL